MPWTEKIRQMRDASKDRNKILVMLLLIIIGYVLFAPDKSNKRSAVPVAAQH